MRVWRVYCAGKGKLDFADRLVDDSKTRRSDPTPQRPCEPAPEPYRALLKTKPSPAPD